MFEISLIFIFSNFQNDKTLGDPPLIVTVFWGGGADENEWTVGVSDRRMHDNSGSWNC